jgi:PKD domain
MKAPASIAIWMAMSLVAIAAPAAASGATLCVHQGGSCPAGQVDEGSDLQKAFNDAASANSTIEIGSGTYSHAGGFSLVTSATALSVNGAGAGQTVLKATGTGLYVLELSGTGAANCTLEGVTIALDGHSQHGLEMANATASGIETRLDPGADPGESGVFLMLATLRDSTIQAGGESGVGIDATSASDVIGHVSVSAAKGVVAAADTTVRRSTIHTSGGGALRALGTGTDLTADDDLIVQKRTGAAPAPVVAAEEGGSLTLRSSTVVSEDDEEVGLFSTNGSGDATSLTANNSILSGFDASGSYYRLGEAGGSADMTIEYDDIGPGTDSATNGTLTASSNIDADPRFVDPASGDFRPRYDSPAIDGGGECLSLCLGIADLDGVSRPIDGDGDGVAVRDLGAYEYARRAPSAVATSDRAAAASGERIQFDGGQSSDPDHGDTLTYSWAFDDGDSAAGAAVSHAFATAGSHTATLTVTDPTGLQASDSVTVAVAGRPGRAGRPDTRITRARISRRSHRASFRFRSVGGAGGSFQCRLLRRKARRSPRFSACRSPKTYRHLTRGRYRFEVRAVDSAGADPTPARKSFRLR